MNLFDQIRTAPADPILGLSEAFKNDPNPNKINLSVGVYQDENGKSPVLASVAEATRRLAEAKASKTYLPINGQADYLRHAQNLVFGENNEMVETGRIVSLHTPGGTGGLRIAAEFLRTILLRQKIWLSRPTWANHQGIFAAAGMETDFYPYFNAGSHSLNLEGMLTVLQNIPNNDPVLFHACCHNPTGVDPSLEDWETIAKICKEHQLLPVLDFAYQGFAHGVVEDAAAVRAFAQYGLEFLVCSSFSKNFGLYQDRVGALHLVCKNKEEANNALSQLKSIVRTNYSNPPAHGGAIVTTILNDRNLTQQWEEELQTMRSRIRTMRQLFVQKLKEKGVPGDFSFIEHQNGMFSFSGLNEETVQKLREKHSIYIVGNGRINVAGMTSSNIDTLCDAIKDCLS